MLAAMQKTHTPVCTAYLGPPPNPTSAAGIQAARTVFHSIRTHSIRIHSIRTHSITKNEIPREEEHGTTTI